MKDEIIPSLSCGTPLCGQFHLPGHKADIFSLITPLNTDTGNGHFLACEQALLFGRAKRAARERANAPRSRVSSRACTFHDIPQMESLLAG